MELEKLKLYLDFAKFFLGTFLIGLVTFIVKSGFESREIAIEESEQIGKYVEIALREDIGVRKRFAEYFKAVTISDEYRDRWAGYYELVKGEYDSIREKAILIEKKIDSIEKLRKNEKDSISEVYTEQLDRLNSQKSKLEYELEVNSEKSLPDSYQMVFHSLNPKENTKELILNYLKSNGFELAEKTDHESRRDWMAGSSTIFYYNNISKFAAGRLASDLNKLTGINFNIQSVSETAKRQDQRSYKLIIHYIN